MSAFQRQEIDIMKLSILDNPKGPYENGIWKVRVELPPQYPYRSPSIGFDTRIFHPNVDEISGSICLDIINQTWSPMFDLVNIFEVFLPQLLLYPNASDPLNSDAANIYLRDLDEFNETVRKYVKKYALLNDAIQTKQYESPENEDTLSDLEYNDVYKDGILFE